MRKNTIAILEDQIGDLWERLDRYAPGTSKYRLTMERIRQKERLLEDAERDYEEHSADSIDEIDYLLKD